MNNKRQAVVIIHGIGEQRPMKTLRGFVTSLLNYEKNLMGDHSNKRTFWTKPDRISNSFELRKISAKGYQEKRSTTHFYEYHWAANMRDTKWRHILSWFWSLMFRGPQEMTSKRLLVLWSSLWFAFLSWFIIAAIFFYNWLWLKMHPLESLSFFQKVILAIPIFSFLLHNIFIGFIGDAARYLRVSVENIQQREQIRKNGVDLLKALHETGDYDRIIVVGHSLGSVIAYDIITYLWIDFNKAINLNQDEDCIKSTRTKWPCSFGLIKPNTKELEDIQAYAKAIREGTFNPESIDDLQTAQRNLWQKIQYERKSWLISDLITLGSPLAHAKLLMADSETDFALRTEEREYPLSPPLLDGDDLTYPSGNGNMYLHHATPFAVTRWTNLYFKGDFIAGKIAQNFGPGIKDIRVSYTGGFLSKLNSTINPLSHNHYWLSKSEARTINQQKQVGAIQELYDSMRLNDIESNIYKSEENGTNKDM